MPFHRRRFDVQPTNPVEVMLASDGRQDYSQRAVARAAALSPSGPVAVVTIAKIYGSSFGLPHPGLLPTKAELAERRGWVEGAVRDAAGGRRRCRRSGRRDPAGGEEARGGRPCPRRAHRRDRRDDRHEPAAPPDRGRCRRRAPAQAAEGRRRGRGRAARSPTRPSLVSSGASSGRAGADAAREPVGLVLGLVVEDCCDRPDELCHRVSLVMVREHLRYRQSQKS